MVGILEGADVRREPRSGRVLAVRGDFPLPAGDEDPIKAFLAGHAAELGLERVSSGDLRRFHSVQTPTRTITRYQQLVDGLRVLGAVIVAQTSKANRLKKLDLGHVRSPEVIRVEGARLTAEQALNAAVAEAGGTVRQAPKEPELVYFPTRQGLLLAWLVLIPTRDPMRDWQIVVDVHEGRILSKRNLMVEVNGSGMVFDPNPVVTAMNNTFRDPTGTPAACGFTGTPVATLDAERVTRTLQDIGTNSSGLYVLEGPYVKIHDFGNPNTTLPAETNQHAFNYSCSDERFEPVLIYYHVDTVQRYIQSLGITTAHNSQIEADPHEGNGGAWFSPVDGGLHFGNSGPCQVNRAQDGDVPLHEYGHAIQYDQVPDWGATNPITGRAETRAMGEGFGDILATVYFAPDHQFQQEVFEDWVFVPAGLRRVDGTKVYPTDWSSWSEHANGEIWSAALWNIYRDIGGDSADPNTRRAARDELLKALILSHHSLTGDASMPEGAEALMEIHAELDDQRGVHLMQMLDSFHERGLLVCGPSANLHIRDTETDIGVDPVAGDFWNSPDLWVRNTDDGITTPQNPERGQDNWFYARVWNRGTETARAFVVTFNVKTWAGTQFVYPGDFVPCISAACGFNLAPGASTIVKAKWPASLVPATGTHGCLLASVYTPVDVSPAGKHVWEHNNLAQRNLTVVDLVPGDSTVVPLQLGNRLVIDRELFRLEVLRPLQWAHMPVALIHSNVRELTTLLESVDRIERAPVALRPSSTIHFLEPSRIELRRPEGGPVRIDLARDSRLLLDPEAAPARNMLSLDREVALEDSSAMPALVFKPGRVAGFPFMLGPRARLKVGVRVTVPADARPGESSDIHVVQRNKAGDVVGGITIRVNVK